MPASRVSRKPGGNNRQERKDAVSSREDGNRGAGNTLARQQDWTERRSSAFGGKSQCVVEQRESISRALSSWHPCALRSILRRLEPSTGMLFCPPPRMVASCKSCWRSHTHCCISSTKFGTKSSRNLGRTGLALADCLSCLCNWATIAFFFGQCAHEDHDEQVTRKTLEMELISKLIRSLRNDE